MPAQNFHHSLFMGRMPVWLIDLVLPNVQCYKSVRVYAASTDDGMEGKVASRSSSATNVCSTSSATSSLTVSSQ